MKINLTTYDKCYLYEFSVVFFREHFTVLQDGRLHTVDKQKCFVLVCKAHIISSIIYSACT